MCCSYWRKIPKTKNVEEEYWQGEEGEKPGLRIGTCGSGQRVSGAYKTSTLFKKRSNERSNDKDYEKRVYLETSKMQHESVKLKLGFTNKTHRARKFEHMSYNSSLYA